MNAAGRLNSHLLADRGLFDTANFLKASDILRDVCTKASVRIKVLDLGHILEAQPEPEEHDTVSFCAVAPSGTTFVPGGRRLPGRFAANRGQLDLWAASRIAPWRSPRAGKRAPRGAPGARWQNRMIENAERIPDRLVSPNGTSSGPARLCSFDPGIERVFDRAQLQRWGRPT